MASRMHFYTWFKQYLFQNNLHNTYIYDKCRYRIWQQDYESYTKSSPNNKLSYHGE